MAAKVLLIEDSATVRLVIKTYLAGEPFEFIEASSGTDGLALLRSERPKVVVLDLKLPGMDGLTFIRTVRADPAHRGVPIILLTSSRGEEVKREAKLAGATHFMTKPIDAALLSQLVHSCLRP